MLVAMAQSVGRDSVLCERRWRRSWAEMGSDNVACGREIAWHVDGDGVAYGRRWRGMWAEMLWRMGGDEVACGLRWRGV